MSGKWLMGSYMLSESCAYDCITRGYVLAILILCESGP